MKKNTPAASSTAARMTVVLKFMVFWGYQRLRMNNPTGKRHDSNMRNQTEHNRAVASKIPGLSIAAGLVDEQPAQQRRQRQADDEDAQPPEVQGAGPHGGDARRIHRRGTQGDHLVLPGKPEDRVCEQLAVAGETGDVEALLFHLGVGDFEDGVEHPLIAAEDNQLAGPFFFGDRAAEQRARQIARSGVKRRLGSVRVPPVSYTHLTLPT